MVDNSDAHIFTGYAASVQRTDAKAYCSGLFALAVLVGAGSGGAAVLFRLGIERWTLLLTGAGDYTLSLGPSFKLLSFAGRRFVLVAPVLSGLLVGPLMARLGRTRTDHSISSVISFGQPLLQPAKGVFPMAGKIAFDRAMEQRFDQIVGVHGKEAGQLGQCPGNTALARTHEADDKDISFHTCYGEAPDLIFPESFYLP